MDTTITTPRRWLATAALVLALAVGLVPVAGAGEAQAAPAAPCPSLESCYSYEQMDLFYDQVIDLVGGFSTASYADMPPPSAWVYVPHGDAVVNACGSVSDENAYEYCSADNTVYIGQDRLWQFYTQQGDAGAAFGIAHEWGHHVQSAAGVTAVADTRLEGIDAENQADCVAGAFVAHLERGGRLESDDAEDIDATLVAIASAEDDPERDHGTLDERTDAALLGYTGGLAACNGWFPGNPILT
ncbi:neutral zinc metallopeptidase [Actinomycetospora sp. CA-101289]|uniref:neutral zinc metallopeptidase n=1 Tax=Actinomycetospora sp. CA-101289 TaxID=3239893 RepID=UPI003D9906B0